MSEHITPPEPTGYWAFLSYSHRDERWASWLHRALETYRLPRQLIGSLGKYGALPRSLFPVFRDREELASAADLPARIREALGRSRAMVVICSPSAARSRWVAEEIRVFKAMRGDERVYCIIVDGEPHASDIPGREAEECFSEPIRYRVAANGELTGEAAEPVAADARPAADGRDGALLKLLAGLLGIELEVLRRRDERRRRRRNQIGVVAASTLIVLLSAGIWYTNVQRREAERQRDLAHTRQEVALARQLAAESSRIRLEQPAAIELAGLLAIEAARRLDTLETQQALQAVLRLLPAQTLRLAKGNSNAAANYSNDGRVALADQSDRLSAFSVPQGHPLWEVPKHYNSKPVLTPDGCCVLYFDCGRLWHVLRLIDGREMQPAPAYLTQLQTAPSDRTRRLEFSRDGRLLAVGPQLVDTVTGTALHDPVSEPSAEFTFDSTGRLLARRTGRNVALFAPGGAKLLQSWQLAREEKLIFSPDSALLAGTGYRGLELFDTLNGQRLFELTCDESFEDATFSTDAKVLATACGNVVRLHDARSGILLAELQHDGQVASVRFSRDGARVLTAGYDNTVRIWHLADRREIWRAAVPDYMTQATFAPNERSILAAGDGGIYLWPLGEETDWLAEIPGLIWALAASPDARWIAAAGVEPQAQVVAVRVSDGQTRELAHPEKRVAGLAFSPDSRLLAVTEWRALSVLPVEGGQALFHRQLDDYPDAAIVGSAFTPEGQLLIATTGKSLRGYFRLDRCDLSKSGDKQFCVTRELPLDPFSDAQPFFSTDGRRVAFSANQNLHSSLRLWDTLGGSESILPARRVKDLVLTSDRLFLALEAGGSVEILDTAGRTLRSIAHEGWVFHLALAPDGQYLAGALADPLSPSKNRVVLWRLGDGEEVARYARPGDDGPVIFLPDGHRLAYSDGDKLRIDAWRREDVIALACARLTRNLDCGQWRTWLGDESYRPTCPTLPSAACAP